MKKISELDLTIKELIGQLVMPRIDFNDRDYFEKAANLVEEYCVGGFIVFNGQVDQVKSCIEKLQSISKIPLFFSCDAERGLGQIVSGATKFPFLMSQGAISDKSLLEAQAECTANEMRICGFNLLFAPVLDINSDQSNPIINIRAFSDNSKKVANLGKKFIESVEKKGVLTCAKHFPGHGDCSVDSHVDLPIINKSYEELSNLELLPFIEAINSNVSSIMLAHIALPKISDSNIPATFSRKIVKIILRDKLGFNGLIITDSYRMDALKSFGDESSYCLQSVTAGCDIILDPIDSKLVVESLINKVKDDQEVLEIVKQSVRRIFEYKSSINLEKEEGKISFQSQLVQEICDRSACVIKNGTEGADLYDINIFDITNSRNKIAITFVNYLEQNHIKINSVNYFSPGNDLNINFKNNIPSINLIFTSVSAWNRYTFLPENFVNCLKKIEGQKLNNVLISFGSPYSVRHFKNFDNIICLFDSIDFCQISAAKVFLDQIKIRGEIPVRL